MYLSFEYHTLQRTTIYFKRRVWIALAKSMALEIIEGFFAVVTLVQCFTGCGAKFADAVGMFRLASGTGNRHCIDCIFSSVMFG
jgi:hypothetical protein